MAAATTMPSPPQTSSPPPSTPPSKPVIPRSQAPRPPFNPAASSSPVAITRPSPTHDSRPMSNPPSSSSSASSSYASSSRLPLTTPSTSSPSLGTTVGTISGSNIPRQVGVATVSSSASVNGLGGTGVAMTNSQIAPTPQTGASRMAAAAKRGQAGLDTRPKASTAEKEEEHPLSEKSLRAQCVTIPPFLTSCD